MALQEHDVGLLELPLYSYNKSPTLNTQIINLKKQYYVKT